MYNNNKPKPSLEGKGNNQEERNFPFLSFFLSLPRTSKKFPSMLMNFPTLLQK
jgi:hypothetical protein